MRDLPSSLDQVLRSALSRHKLLHKYDCIRPYARITFLLRVSPPNDCSSIPNGKSRLGGTPDLPPKGEWARNPADGLLLDFIGQINLSELPAIPHPLPNAGLLLLYSRHDGAAENCHTIQFIDQTDSLSRAAVPHPESYSDETNSGRFDPVLVTEFLPSVSLPDSLETFPDFDDELHDYYGEMVQELHDDPVQKEPTSRLLGYPFSPYGSVLPTDDWELLIEVESYFQGGKCYMNFWDAGCLQLMVPSSQLSTCRFTEGKATVFSM